MSLRSRSRTAAAEEPPSEAIAARSRLAIHRGAARIAATRDDTEMERLLARFNPWILPVTRTGDLLGILYLMMFKPSF